MTRFVILVSLCLLVHQLDSAKILFIPRDHYSHTHSFGIAARFLQDAGHDVTVLVAERNKERIHKMGIKTLVYGFSEYADTDKTIAMSAETLLTNESPMLGLGPAMLQMRYTLRQLCHEIMQNKGVMQHIKEAKYDLTINDLTPALMCTYTINYKYNIPFISMSPTNVDPWIAGVSSSPALEASWLTGFHGKLSFMQRVANLFMCIIQNSYLYPLSASTAFISRYVPDKPTTTMKEIVSKSEMFLITVDVYCFDAPRISAPNLKYIGSLSAKAQIKPFPQPLLSFTEQSKEGIILISFGSYDRLQSALIPVIDKLLTALAKMKENVILQVKPHVVQYSNVTSNIFVSSWLPQNDILAHPKTKLFISHGGINSHLEATYHGVPILTLPFVWEQRGNGLRAETMGHGALLEWKTVTSNQLYYTMRQLIDDPKYKNKIQKCSAILKSLPDPGKEFVFWVDHILHFGGSHLRPLVEDMGLVEFFLLDVLLFIGFVVAVLVVILYLCCTTVISRFGKYKHKQA